MVRHNCEAIVNFEQKSNFQFHLSSSVHVYIISIHVKLSNSLYHCLNYGFMRNKESCHFRTEDERWNWKFDFCSKLTIKRLHFWLKYGSQLDKRVWPQIEQTNRRYVKGSYFAVDDCFTIVSYHYSLMCR
jgi:hypothetical protein